jgi:hypothetical protein
VVVEQLGDDAFEVEFVNASGRTYGVHTLEAGQLLRLHTQARTVNKVTE